MLVRCLRLDQVVLARTINSTIDENAANLSGNPAIFDERARVNDGRV